MDAAAAILALLAERRDGTTACPSEVARRLSPDGWRERMQEVRDAAAALADEGRVEVRQRGRVVDARRARGPVRLALPDDRRDDR